VMTPWHEDDLSGRIISEMARGGEQWIILRLPAEAEENDPLGREPGEFLWDDDPKYPYGQHLRREKTTQSARNWSALYQGRPTPETGNYFQAEWLRPYTQLPDDITHDQLRVYGASDYATKSGDGDYTVHAVVGMDYAENMFLLDLWRGQASSDVWV